MENINELSNKNMTPIDGAGGAALGKAVSFLLPKGWDWLMNQLYGKKILIVGPGRSGKTSFKNYLSKGILLNETATSKTKLHSKFKGSIIKVNSGTFEIKLKSLTDSPGQIGPLIHAESVQEYRPHFLFVFLNCEETDESIKWFQDFAESLYSIFRDYPDLVNRIKSIFIVLNKKDKLTGRDEKEINLKYKTFHDKIKSIALDEWKFVYYKASGSIKVPNILPAICVRNTNASKLLEEIINTMASKI